MIHQHIITLRPRSVWGFARQLPKTFFKFYFVTRHSCGRWNSFKAALALSLNAIKSHVALMKKHKGGVFLTVGTKSVLYGYHCFFIHPFFVAYAWTKLFGFPFDPRLWVAFLVHDLGYIGKPNMDGPEGETHVMRGAFIMGALFGARWYEFTLLHSRFFAAKLNAEPSQLCFADKYAIVVAPARLQLFLCRQSGELGEYMQGRAGRTPAGNKTPLEWVQAMQDVCRDFVIDNLEECRKCGRLVHPATALTIPPSYFSDDGLTSFYCAKCAGPVHALADSLAKERH